MARTKPTTPPSASWPILITAAGFFLAEVVVLAGAASPFRLPKEAAALAALCAAVGLAVVAAARRGMVELPGVRLAAVLIALPALQLVSALWSTSPVRSIESAILTLIWVTGTLWLATIDGGGRRRIAFAAAIGVALSVIVMLVQLAGFSVFNFAAPFATARLSLTGLTGNPADLAMASVLLLPFLLVWGESASRQWPFRTLAVLFALATLLTQTLTGIAALGAVTLVWLAQRRSRRLWIAVAGVGTVVVAVALAAGLGERLQQQVGRLQAGNWYRLLSARGDGWTAAEEMIRDHPATGVGAACFTHQYYPSRLAWLTRNGGTGGREELASHFQWAHCDPLQMAAELGIPGVAWMAVFGFALLTCRRQAGPLLPLTAAAVTPFILLHYPTHLAVGLVPISLSLAEIVARSQPPTTIAWRWARAPIALAAAVLAGAGVLWQLRRVAADVFIGGLELRMALVQSADPESRARMGAAIENQIMPQVERLGARGPEAWRALGRARLLRGDAPGAEAAFNQSYASWPHEDAEFYLGMSLFAQGRRNEALSHLNRVCRTNPKLADLIADETLRSAVTDAVATYRRQ